MSDSVLLRAAHRMARRKGYIVRKRRGHDEYTLAFARGLASTRPPLVFDDLTELMSELRMR